MFLVYLRLPCKVQPIPERMLTLVPQTLLDKRCLKSIFIIETSR